MARFLIHSYNVSTLSPILLRSHAQQHGLTLTVQDWEYVHCQSKDGSEALSSDLESLRHIQWDVEWKVSEGP